MIAGMTPGEHREEDGEWNFLDYSSLPGRQDPTGSRNDLAMDARNNIETLRDLLSSSTPGGTPDTLEPQHHLFTEENSQQDVDISREINSLINFVDNFEFQSPVAPLKFQHQQQQENRKVQDFSLNQNVSQSLKSRSSTTKQDPEQSYRNPLLDRTNETLWKEHSDSVKPANTHPVAVSQEPDGMLLHSDRSDVELSPNHRQLQQPEESDWDKFNQLVRQVEHALQEANQEREATRSWARQVREATKSWVEEQRSLIEKDRATMLEDRRHDGSPPEEKAFYEAKIERLENTIRGLELDLKTSELHHQTNERRLHNIIKYQEENLRKLEEANASGRSNSTPWAKQQAYVSTLEARTQELKNRVTPWPPQQHPKESNTAIRQQLMKVPSDQYPTQSTNSALVQEKEEFFEEQAAFTLKSNKQPQKISSTKGTYHKPFGGTTPGSSGLRKKIDFSSKLPPRVPNSCNMRVVTFANGARKQVRDDGSSVVRFSNGDVQIFPSAAGGSTAYYHFKSQVIEVATSDGSVIFEYPNKQVERHYPDGRKVVKFPDGTKKRIYPDGMVETFLSCGKYLIIEHPNGTKDVKHL